MTLASSLSLPHGNIQTPAFLPDATYGAVRALDASDLEAIDVQALVMNTFHLMQRPGSSTIQALGGLHAMSGWPRPILTDSGGFQAYSVIRENPKFGSLTDKGISFRRESDRRKFQLTPEKTVQLQLSYGADMVITLDDCTHVEDDYATQKTAVERTVAWARRCRAEFDRLLKEKNIEGDQVPLLFAVIQGGGELELRRECAEQLLEIGFDGYGFGGWPLDADYNLLADILQYTRELVPVEFPMHALGVGHPEYVAVCARMGYGLFDSALPTRDARRGRLYSFRQAEGLRGDWFQFLYIDDDKHLKDPGPISEFCDCPACARYSRGYLRHLFKLDDHLYHRLATLHNLRFMRLLEGRLRDERQ